MAINIFGGRPNVGIALASYSFAELGFNASNIAIIYEIDNAIRSWIPTRPFNPLAGIEKGKGYWIVAKVDINASPYFAPPVPSGVIGVLGDGLGNVIGDGLGSVIAITN